MKLVSWRILFLLSVVVKICVLVYILARSVEPNTNAKQNHTVFDEFDERRRQGFLDNIPLGDLLPCTEFLKKPAFQCANDTKAVILVQSACSHESHREAIRTTWGKSAGLARIPVFFFLGQCPGHEEEIASHGDIVQVDFVDSYFNNTLKTLSRYRWFVNYCQPSTHLVMTDDDAIIVVDALVNVLNEGIGYSILGPYYKQGTYVIRGKESKWYVPTWVWQTTTYPEYIGGGTYVVNGSVVSSLFHLSLEIPYISIDDMFFTGFIAGMLGMKRVKDFRFPKKTKHIGCLDKSIVASQGFTPEEIVEHWERLRACGLDRKLNSNVTVSGKWNKFHRT